MRAAVRELPTLDDYVRLHAATRRETLALAGPDVAFRYGELRDEVDRYARAMRAAGVGRGDVVGVLGFSRPECLLGFLAACRLGALFLGLNPKHTTRELAHVVGDSRPRLLVDMRGDDLDGRGRWLRALRESSPSIATLVTRPAAVPGLSTSLDDFLAGGARTGDVPSPAGPGDPCAIVYTSGSTGAPKGALLSQAAMIRSAVISWEHWYGALTPQRTVVQHPIDHVGWLVCECISTLVPGGTMFFRERFSGSETLRLVERERLNLWVAFPSMLMLAMDTPEFRSCDLSSLRTVALGMSATVDVMRAFQSRSGAAMRVSYGLTEASGGAVTATARDDDLEVVATCVGRPLPGVEVRLAGDGGEAPAAGQAGELLVRDRCLFLGYLNRPDATAAALDGGGWLHTGDLAVADEAGRLSLVGRRHEMFKSGGYNVYPTEVEAVIGRHPAVGAAAVVEVADELWGEVGVAFVVPRPGSRVDEVELRSFALGRLANYKVPKRFVLVEALPELPNGKFDRIRLRAEARSARAGGSAPLPRGRGWGRGIEVPGQGRTASPPDLPRREGGT